MNRGFLRGRGAKPHAAERQGTCIFADKYKRRAAHVAAQPRNFSADARTGRVTAKFAGLCRPTGSRTARDAAVSASPCNDQQWPPPSPVIARSEATKQFRQPAPAPGLLRHCVPRNDGRGCSSGARWPGVERLGFLFIPDVINRPACGRAPAAVRWSAGPPASRPQREWRTRGGGGTEIFLGSRCRFIDIYEASSGSRAVAVPALAVDVLPRSMARIAKLTGIYRTARSLRSLTPFRIIVILSRVYVKTSVSAI
jgi:hypothetical protein